MCVLPCLPHKYVADSLWQRTRYLNAVNTFKELLHMGVVPIVNENDTISVSVSVDLTMRYIVLHESRMPGN
jgi:hypothetical protein